MRSNFGVYIKEMRLRKGLSLRAFCVESGVEPSNYSKVERGLLPPPSEPQKLEPYRQGLGLSENSSEWRELTRLAALDRGEIPHRTLSNQDLVDKLPALFRMLEGGPMDNDILQEIVAAIKHEHTA